MGKSLFAPGNIISADMRVIDRYNRKLLIDLLLEKLNMLGFFFKQHVGNQGMNLDKYLIAWFAARFPGYLTENLITDGAS